MEVRLAAKRALVTGANSGIGKAIALGLGAAGARVAINYVENQSAAEQTVADVRRGGSDAFVIEADVSDAAQVSAMFLEIDRRWGGIDILVNNAGIEGDREMGCEGISAAWRRVLDTNLAGAYHCAREAMGRMVRQQAGVILNITSVHEVIPWSGYSAYTASKAGLSMLTKNLAQEAASQGVRVVALAPGAIRTRLTQSDAVGRIPMGRVGTPEEIAQMAVVLCSEIASYVTGTTVFVDGGMTLYPSAITMPHGEQATDSQATFLRYASKVSRLVPGRIRRALKRVLYGVR
jgi:glucose 1-dehydrogenase